MINRYMCAYGTEFTKGINGHWCEWPEVEQVIAENQRLQSVNQKRHIAEARAEKAEARLQEKDGYITELVQEVQRLQAELAEAEKEIHVRAEGEEKEWERAEKFKAENQRLQERVRDWKPSGTVLKESLMRGLRCSPRRGSDVELSNNETHRG